MNALATIVAEEGDQLGFLTSAANDPFASSCVYTGPNNEPVCIVGRLFDRLGIDRPAYGSFANGNTIGGLAQAEAFTATARRLLDELQAVNDVAGRAQDTSVTLQVVVDRGLTANAERSTT